jgi:hypothetical protein
MSCKLGRHKLRDSYHIVPVPLRGWKKDDIDYDKLRRETRDQYKDEITKYCIADCRYTHQVVSKFIADFGLKLTMGQASIAKLKSTQTFDRLGEITDGKLRGINTDRRDKEGYNSVTGCGYFFGGRVECIAGAGLYTGRFQLYDVNSMYPFVMAYYNHPIGSNYLWREGSPTKDTAFLEIECENYGGLISRVNGMTTGDRRSGVFYTTIHEYLACVETGLIGDHHIRACVDCDRFTTFADFVLPIYNRRMVVKQELDALAQQKMPFPDNLLMEALFLKLLLNSSYGKFAQNPREFCERMITDYNDYPGEEWTSELGVINKYSIWKSPPPIWNKEKQAYEKQDYKFNNVGTGASITGAARAVLLRAVCKANNPIYCDTDSIICSHLDCDIDAAKLGSWKLEKTLSEVIICGKKLYATKSIDGKIEVVKSKGVSELNYDEMRRILTGDVVKKIARAPTLSIDGSQGYLTRKVQMTAPMLPSLLGETLNGRQRSRLFG